jgi:hypothetical protein
MSQFHSISLVSVNRSRTETQLSPPGFLFNEKVVDATPKTTHEEKERDQEQELLVKRLKIKKAWDMALSPV